MSQMQELTELKNLVIQSLEANGSLAKIRAQIRASVFNVVDQQDGQPKKPSPFFWENNKAQSIYDLQGGREILELIKDFLASFEMHYTLSIFQRFVNNSNFFSESNLREDVNREQLAKKFNADPTDQKPLLHQVIFSQRSQRDSAAPQPEKHEQKHEQKKEQKQEQKHDPKAEHAEQIKQDQQRKQDHIKEQQQQKIEQQKAAELQKQEQQKQEQQRQEQQKQEQQRQEQQRQDQLKKEQLRLKEEQKQEELKRQLELEKQKVIAQEKEQEKQRLEEQRIQAEKQKEIDKEKARQDKLRHEQKVKEFDEIQRRRAAAQQQKSEEYEDEKFEEIEDEAQMFDEMGESGLKKQGEGMFTSSEEFMQGSQSQGFDMTVDSMALEEFDYYEDVEDM